MSRTKAVDELRDFAEETLSNLNAKRGSGEVRVAHVILRVLDDRAKALELLRQAQPHVQPVDCVLYKRIVALRRRA